MIRKCFVLSFLLLAVTLVAIYKTITEKNRKQYILQIIRAKNKMSAMLKENGDLSLPSIAFKWYIYEGNPELFDLIDWGYGKGFCRNAYRKERTLFTEQKEDKK